MQSPPENVPQEPIQPAAETEVDVSQPDQSFQQPRQVEPPQPEPPASADKPAMENKSTLLMISLAINFILLVIILLLVLLRPAEQQQASTTPTPTTTVTVTEAVKSAGKVVIDSRGQVLNGNDLEITFNKLTTEKAEATNETNGVLSGAVDKMSITGADFVFEVGFVYEIETDRHYDNAVKAGQNQQMGGLYRNEFQDGIWEYTNDYRMDNSCETPGTEQIEPPCGLGAVKIGSDPVNYDYAVYIICSTATESGLARCDDLAGSLIIKTLAN